MRERFIYVRSHGKQEDAYNTKREGNSIAAASSSSRMAASISLIVSREVSIRIREVLSVGIFSPLFQLVRSLGDCLEHGLFHFLDSEGEVVSLPSV